jgi:lysozyme
MSRLRRNTALAAIVVVAVSGFEGLRLAAYRDPVGIPTACFGETKGIRLGMKFTRPECEAMLTESLVKHEMGMVKCLNNPELLLDGAYGAFVSFTYNVGVGAFCKSTAARLINAGSVKGACDQLLRWDRAAGIRLPGLTKRRKAERELCLEGL